MTRHKPASARLEMLHRVDRIAAPVVLARKPAVIGKSTQGHGLRPLYPAKLTVPAMSAPKQRKGRDR